MDIILSDMDLIINSRGKDQRTLNICDIRFAGRQLFQKCDKVWLMRPNEEPYILWNKHGITGFYSEVVNK